MRVAADGVGLTQFGGVVVIMKRTRLLELPRERRRDNPMTHSSIHWILSLNWLFQRGDKCDTFSWAPADPLDPPVTRVKFLPPWPRVSFQESPRPWCSIVANVRLALAG